MLSSIISEHLFLAAYFSLALFVEYPGILILFRPVAVVYLLLLPFLLWHICRYFFISIYWASFEHNIAGDRRSLLLCTDLVYLPEECWCSRRNMRSIRIVLRAILSKRIHFLIFVELNRTRTALYFLSLNSNQQI